MTNPRAFRVRVGALLLSAAMGVAALTGCSSTNAQSAGGADTGSVTVLNASDAQGSADTGSQAPADTGSRDASSGNASGSARRAGSSVLVPTSQSTAVSTTESSLRDAPTPADSDSTSAQGAHNASTGHLGVDSASDNGRAGSDTSADTGTDRGKARQTTPAPPPRTTSAEPRPPAVITAALLDKVNAYRAAAGVPPVAPSTCAENYALAHSKAQASQETMFHSDMNDLMAQCDASAGENVGVGGTDAAAIVTAWYHSGKHRRNLLDPDYRYMGIAVAYSSAGHAYYTQEFLTK